jgi:hypothetical protein
VGVAAEVAQDMGRAAAMSGTAVPGAKIRQRDEWV